MAQQNTGLGWSAKSNWLMQASGTIAAIRGLVGGAKIPYAVNANDAIANGFYSFKIIYPNYEEINYLAANDPDADVVCNAYFYQGNNYACVAYSTTRNTTVTRYQLNTRTNRVTTTTYTLDTALPNSSVIWRKGVSPSVWGSDREGNPDITIYNSADEAYAAISDVDYVFQKVNSGYAVACIANWYTPGGVLITTPVLISSDKDSTNMSCNNSSYNVARTSFQYDGTRFYISFWDCVNQQFSSLLEVANLTQFGAAAIEKVFNLIAAESFSNILVTETQDPYDPFGNTGEDGGEVDPDPDDDDIEVDPLPTTSFADAGFCRIYSPSLVQLDSLSNYLWTDQTFLQTVINHLKQIIENPIDAIISLSLVPCVPPTSSAEEVKVMFVPTGVYMPPVTNQFVEVDCGSFTLKEMYGSALDYNPYTSVQLYLPYVGIVQLDTDEVMGKTIHVGYRIDVVTGVCCAYVQAGGDVLYQFSGHCSIQQPITSADFSGYINAVLAAGKLVASIAAAGAGAPEVAASLVGAPAPSVTSTSSDTRTTERNEATGRQITAGTKHRETKTEHSGASFGEVAAKGISNTVGSVMNSKTIIQHSGGFSGNSGYIAAVRRPYLIVTRPRIANPEQYAQFNGRPSMIYLKLGDCTGFTQVQSIHLTGIDATNPELSEIATLLTSGVIF